MKFLKEMSKSLHRLRSRRVITFSSFTVVTKNQQLWQKKLPADFIFRADRVIQSKQPNAILHVNQGQRDRIGKCFEESWEIAWLSFTNPVCVPMSVVKETDIPDKKNNNGKDVTKKHLMKWLIQSPNA